jgi:hypothetical protein
MIYNNKAPTRHAAMGRFVIHCWRLGRDRLGQLRQAGYFATGGALMQNAFLGGLINGRLGSFELRIQDLTVLFGYCLADILYDGLNASFY